MTTSKTIFRSFTLCIVGNTRAMLEVDRNAIQRIADREPHPDNPEIGEAPELFGLVVAQVGEDIVIKGILIAEAGKKPVFRERPGSHFYKGKLVSINNHVNKLRAGDRNLDAFFAFICASYGKVSTAA